MLGDFPQRDDSLHIQLHFEDHAFIQYAEYLAGGLLAGSEKSFDLIPGILAYLFESQGDTAVLAGYVQNAHLHIIPLAENLLGVANIDGP